MLLLYKFMLGPVLLFQGHRIRKSALRLPEASGPRAGTAGHATCARQLRVLFVGDSSAAGVGVDSQHDALAPQAAVLLSERTGAQVAWQLVAQSGVNTNEAIELISTADLMPADLVVTALGVNDVTTQRSPGQFIFDYKALVDQLMRRTGAKALIATGLPPLHILPAAPQPLRWYLGKYAKTLDAKLQHWIRMKREFAYISLQWAAKPNEMARDGYHPGIGQYRHWAHLVAEQAALLLEAPYVREI